MLKKKDNRTLNRSKDMFRILTVAILFCAVVLLFLFQLYVLQVQKGEYYSKAAVPKIYREQVLEVSRGQIYDRNGILLAANKKQYNVVVDKATLDSNDYNTSLLYFVDFCDNNAIVLEDKLPVTDEKPYLFDTEYVIDSSKSYALKKYCKTFELDIADFSEDTSKFYSFIAEKYGVDDSLAQNERYRKLLGLRYDMDCNDFEYLSTYTLISNIDEKTKVLLSESLHRMHGIEIKTTDSRYYVDGSLAPHILGRTGPIYKEEAEEFVVGKGYDYDAIIGKEGAEKAFEEYLHGFDGIEKIQIDDNNNIIGKSTLKDAKNGYSVYLTLDSQMQKVAKEALEREILTARTLGYADENPYSGEDCRTGSVVVMSTNTGEVLVSVSSPGYDLNTYSQDFKELGNSPDKPFLNRATQGKYPPGSTFKIASAIAALSSGIVSADTLVYDKGAYVKYEDYEPHCWIYDNTGATHGYVNVKTALENSCNFYFYEVADKMGIDTINQYAKELGLGSKTGIEIPEIEGILAGPEYRDSIGLLWNPGDTLQAAIGQSDNAFTPIQLCSYMCAVVNGGYRYKATLLHSVVDLYNNKVVLKNTPTVLNKIDIDPYTVHVLKSAMKSVVVEGTARNVFDNYKYDVGGKTGTAQMGKGKSDTALFVGFAPYDDPEIVVAVVVENGDMSARASSVAKSIFDYYFSTIEENNSVSEE